MAAADARRDRHQQHRQLLARLPLADLVRAAHARSASRARPARSPTSTRPTPRSSSAPTRPRRHPVVGARIKQAALRGCRLVTIDPRRIELADYGVLHLAPRPGTNAAVMLGLAHVVAATASLDDGFIADAHRGLRGLRGAARAVHPATRSQEITRRPRRATSSAPRTSTARPRARRSSGASGVTEHKYGSEVVQLICNLAMMTGKVGRPRLGAAAAARPEQRPGLLRHGRAARHLQRLPPRRRRAGGAQPSRRPGASRCPRARATRSRRCSTPPSPAT